jgi:hypothetical protein
MFLCSLDGKIYSDDAVYVEIILKQKDKDGDTSKEITCKSCCLCYGLVNTKYQVEDGNKFIVPPTQKVKIFKISSTNFENKNTDKKEKKIFDKPKTKVITEILKKADADIIKKRKKSKSSLQ